MIFQRNIASTGADVTCLLSEESRTKPSTFNSGESWVDNFAAVHLKGLRSDAYFGTNLDNDAYHGTER